MNYLKTFIYGPGGETESGNSAPETSEQNSDTPEDIQPAKKEEKPIIEKIKEALQDWSNKDELDQEFDDTRV